MDYKVVEKNGNRYIEGIKGKLIIGKEQDALDLIGICGENDTQLILLHSDNLAHDFYDLKTILAGNVLQKFVNYRMKVALVIPANQVKGRFSEMVKESNRGNFFRAFENKDQAVKWLTPDEVYPK